MSNAALQKAMDNAEASINMEGEKMIVKAGEVHYCKKGLSHGLTNEQDETLKILCVVTEQ